MSELYVSVERRYKLFKGQYYVQGIEDISFFYRYLDSFQYVNVIARVQEVKEEPRGFKLFSHDSIKITPIFTSGTGIVNIISLNKIIRKISKSSSYLILRTPGVLSYILSLYCVIQRQKFSLEVVTNPIQEASNLTKNKLVSYIFISIFLSLFKMQLRRCSYAAFVTKYEIQRLFISPTEYTSEKFNSFYSSIILENDDIAEPEIIRQRVERYKTSDRVHLLFIGVLDRPFKGLDIFIKLLAQLPKNYSATVVGDGALLTDYKKMADDLQISARIDFKGYISEKKIKQQIMSSADVFVLTSRREGLPRVVIEAMAWGLPCVCSDVSGVSELVEESNIFPIEDFESAARIICNYTSDDLIRISTKNLEHSLQYLDSSLKIRRADFYQKVISSENFTFKQVL